MKSKQIGKFVAVVAVSVAIVACGNSSSGSEPEPSVPSQSAEVLENYLKTGLSQSAQSMPVPELMVMEDAAALESVSAGSADENFSSTSQTNTQEADVDELNWVKNDDDYIFAFSNDSSLIADSPASLDSLQIYSSTKSMVKVYQMDKGQPSAQPVNSLLTPGSVRGLYLSEKDESGRAEQLVVISDGSFDEENVSAGASEWQYWAWRQQGVDVALYDVSHPAGQIDKVANLTLEGSLVSSRRIGDQLYIVSRFSPYVPILEPYPYTDEQVSANKALLADIDLQELLPRIRIDGDIMPLASSEDCFVPDSAVEGNPTLLTVTAVNLNNPSDYKVSCIGAYAGTVYASANNVYVVASSQQPWQVFWMWDGNSDQSATSTIHRFELTNNGPVYHGEGSVRGEVGWNNQFRLSEYEGHLRVVSSAYGDYLNLGAEFESDFTHSVHTLAIEEDYLRPVATLPNQQQKQRIGKPGERLYSARFFKDKAYLVTFRQIDPFYVIDLSDVERPSIAGELEMPGYSSYLQPIDDDLILGIGRDANLEGRTQGVKVGLFDVSEPAEPSLINEYVIGKAGSYSSAEYDHKAITLLKSDEGNQWRLALPASVSEGEPYWHWSYDGLFLFDITAVAHSDGPSLTQQGVMITARADQQNRYSYYGNYTSGSVLSGDFVHFFSGKDLWSANWYSSEDSIKND